MRLYTTPKEQCAVSQAYVKKLGAYVEYDVPTNKADLLVFLNKYKVNDYAYQGYSAPLEENPQPAIIRDVATVKESSWTNIRRVAEEASLKDLTTAMVIIMTRIDDEIYEKGVK